MTYKTTHELIAAIAKRSRELADLPVKVLRSFDARDPSEKAASIRAYQQYSRGGMVEIIIEAEFGGGVTHVQELE